MASLRTNPNRATRRNSTPVKIIADLETKEETLVASEVATLLRVSRQHVYKLAARQILPSFRVGRSVRFYPDQVADWLRGKMPHQVSSAPDIRIAV